MAPRKKTAETIDATAEDVAVAQVTDPAEIQLPALQASELKHAVSDAKAIEAIIVSIEKAARAHQPGDMAVRKNRDALGSLGLRVASSKRPILDAAKDAKAPLQAKLQQITATEKLTEARLSALRKEITAPKVEWEEAEEARVAAIDKLINRLEKLGDCKSENGMMDLAPKTAKELLEGEVIDERYGEKDGVAANARFAALHKVGQRIEADEAAAAAAKKAEEDARALEEARKGQAEKDAEIEKLRAQLAAATAQAATPEPEPATIADVAPSKGPAAVMAELDDERDDEWPIAEEEANNDAAAAAWHGAMSKLVDDLERFRFLTRDNADDIACAIADGSIRHVRFVVD